MGNNFTDIDTTDLVIAATINDRLDQLDVVIPAACEGRLTLASGTPVTVTDQTAKATVYFTPFRGNRIALYSGTGWVVRSFTEKSISVPATTVTPFDVFAYDNGGVVALEVLSWTNDTTRATGLTTQDGVLVKTGATTRRYLGTGRTTSVSGQTEDSLTYRGLWNYYNRVRRPMLISEATSHTYNTATWRPWNNVQSAADVEFIVGVVEDALSCSVTAAILWAAGNSNLLVGAGLNVTNNISPAAYILHNAAGTVQSGISSGELFPRAGYNYLCCVEFSSAGGTAPTGTRMFLSAQIMG